MPDGAKNSRLKSYKDLDENSSFLKLPNIEGAEYLVGMLYEAGLAGSNGMNMTSLTWTEINNWVSGTDSTPSTWEKLMIKAMSDAYVTEYSLSSDKLRLAPYSHVEEDIAENRIKVANKLKNAFASFKRSA